MRDPARIDEFCEELAKAWHKVPDQRFGQLMSNILGEIQYKYGDIFFPEDAQMITYINEVIDNWTSKKENN